MLGRSPQSFKSIDKLISIKDDPEATEPRDGFDWEDELHKLMKFAKLMKLNDSEAKVCNSHLYSFEFMAHGS